MSRDRPPKPPSTMPPHLCGMRCNSYREISPAMECLALLLVVLLCLGVIVDAAAQNLPDVPGLRLTDLRLASTVDGKVQPVVVGVPDDYDPSRATPLLVGMHTWSAEYRQQVEALGPVCARRGWLMVLPHFRGPNLTSNPVATEAGGSTLAQHDIMDAVAFMQENYHVDTRRIYMLGGSGGGHISLVMAAKYPDVWAAVSAWCPITHLRDWWEQKNSYAQHVAAVCGGVPGSSPQVDFEYLRRSPRTLICNAANTAVFIGHGDHDPTIWPSQTWNTFAELQPLPHRIEFYSWSGGHDMLTERGADWLAQHVKPEAMPLTQTIVSDEAKWYYWAYLSPDEPMTFARCSATAVLATPAQAGEPAQPASLHLTTEHCSEVKIRLASLHLSPPAGATRDGQPLPADNWRVEGDVLVLTPAAKKTEYAFSWQ